MDCCSTDEHFDKHAGHHGPDFLTKFWISLALMLPLIALSNLSDYLALAIGSVIFFYCGKVFLTSAWRELKARLPGMMTLIAVAITTAYLWSVYATLAGTGTTLWWELSTLIAVMLLGHWVEMRAVQGAQGALKELSKLLPDTAELWRDGTTVTVPLSELKMGDVVLVRPGAKIPVDGIVVEGSSELDESIITGESRLIPRTKDDEVIAGALNGDGSLKVRVSKVGAETFLSGVMRLVAEAQRSKSRLQILSDRAALYLTVVAVGAGAITLLVWLYVGAGAAVAVEMMVAVLVIACPHALGLAIPLVSSISTTMAARAGLLVKSRLALESARKISIVLFDKTGTLTLGEFRVTHSSSDAALTLAASVEAHSEHPIGKAVVSKALEQNLNLHNITHFKRVPGAGAEAIVGGKKIFVGHRGGNDLVVEQDGKEVGTLAVEDAVRPEALQAVRTLKSLGLKVAMITGDSEDVAKRVASELGIDEYFARVLPGEKAEKVKLLQSQGETVAMVGDGVNDAPALTQADLGIAIGAGTNVAIESAGIILVKNDPRDIGKIVRLSKLTYGKMIENLFWATGYNVVAMPVAAGVLVPWGITLSPAVAAVFMSLSTVIVSINAVLLRRKTL